MENFPQGQVWGVCKILHRVEFDIVQKFAQCSSDTPGDHLRLSTILQWLVTLLYVIFRLTTNFVRTDNE